MEFPFYDAPNTATIICRHIINGEEPILFVSHDEDDGMWQFLCGKIHETDDAKLVSLKSVFELDNSIGDLIDIQDLQLSFPVDPHRSITLFFLVLPTQLQDLKSLYFLQLRLSGLLLK